MKYQAIKQLKTKNKLLKMCDTLSEAVSLIRGQEPVLSYRGLSYIGQFPIFKGEKYAYSIQGAVFLANGDYVVCSIPETELVSLS